MTPTPETLRELADEPRLKLGERTRARLYSAADAWEELEDDMRQIEQVTRMVMEERCPSDEHHCTCVPLLREALSASKQARQRAENAGRRVQQAFALCLPRTEHTMMTKEMTDALEGLFAALAQTKEELDVYEQE